MIQSLNMNIIQSYQEPVKTQNSTNESAESVESVESNSPNLLYLAKPVYGGWVTFTAHLSHKLKAPIHKITTRTEKNQRDFGYECGYRNISLEDALLLKNVIITALDKHYWQYLPYFSSDTKIVIHDPTECKFSKKVGNPLVQSTEKNEIPVLNKMKVITIRESVQEYLMNKFQIPSEFMPHPFFSYEIPKLKGLGYKCVSIARIDFDKNTDILLKANRLLTNKKNHVYLFGAENRLYVHHKLKDFDIDKYWKGRFPKNLSPVYDGKSILKDAKYMIDMSTIKEDGGGTQYTFLEAIYHDCILILHNEWISKGELFQSGVNCLGVSNETELAELLTNEISDEDYSMILQNSKKILDNHL